MDTVEVDGLRIAYRRSGTGPPLVLFHGAMEDSRLWADELRRLDDRVEVFAWDAPGCGGSDDIPPGWTDRDWADAAAGLIRALALDRPAVAGFSFGSVVALLLARDHPDAVGHLVLLGAYAGWGGSLSPTELAERIASVRHTIDHPPSEWADGFLDSVYAPDADPDRRALARTLIDDWRPQTTQALLEVMTMDVRPTLPEVTVPTTIVRGAADARSPRAVSLALRDAMPRPELVEIPGAGHDCTGPALDAVLVDAARQAAGRAG